MAEKDDKEKAEREQLEKASKGLGPAGGIPTGPSGLTSSQAEEKTKREEQEQAKKNERLSSMDNADSLRAPDGDLHDGSTVHGAVTAVSDLRGAHFPADATGKPLSDRAKDAEIARLEKEADRLKERAAELRKERGIPEQEPDEAASR